MNFDRINFLKMKKLLFLSSLSLLIVVNFLLLTNVNNGIRLKFRDAKAGGCITTNPAQCESTESVQKACWCLGKVYLYRDCEYGGTNCCSDQDCPKQQ